MLYRIFPYLPGASAREAGGALYVPRERQGAGRHDHPDHYGVLYASRTPESAAAEHIQRFRGRTLIDARFRRAGGATYALATFDESALERVIDLDEPLELASRQLRPSLVATQARSVTQEIALRIFHEGVAGFSWWSTLESAWTNVTLFAERSSPRLTLVGDLEPLTVQHPVVRVAAEAIGVRLSA